MTPFDETDGRANDFNIVVLSGECVGERTDLEHTDVMVRTHPLGQEPQVIRIRVPAAQLESSIRGGQRIYASGRLQREANRNVVLAENIEVGHADRRSNSRAVAG